MNLQINLSEYITSSQRNAEKINYQGFLYNIRRKSDSIIAWRCTNRKCYGALHTDLTYNLLKMFPRNHERDFLKVEAKKIKKHINKKALETTETARNILTCELVKNPEVFIKKNINLKYIKDSITKIRKRHNVSFESDSDIPNEVKHLASGELIYSFDSVKEDPKRVIIYTSENFLEYLSNSLVWFIDATFACVPKDYAQLLIIQGMIKEKKFSLFFSLMKCKDETSYNTIFKYLKSIIPYPKVKWISLDFEFALYKSVQIYYTGVNVRGCWFHLNQILWRKINELGFKRLYLKNSNFKLHCRLILSLAFVPLENIKDECHNLKFYLEHLKDCPEESYIIYNWFTKCFVFNIKFFNHSPEFWSVNDRILNYIPMTNNSLKAYNRHINEVSETKQPSLYSLFSEIKIDFELYQVELKRMDLFENNISIKDRKNAEVVKEYETRKGVNFLERIAYHFKFGIAINK